MTPAPALGPAFLTRPIAHRGYHAAALGRPENSRAAVLAAVAAGYGIEIDLQLSADGVPMVFHDEVLDRLTDARGAFWRRPAAELSRMPLRGAPDQTIPPFRDILDLVAGRAPLLVELKAPAAEAGPEAGARLAVATAAELADYAGPVAVMSFDPDLVTAFGAAAPDLPRGLITESYLPGTVAPDVPEAKRRALREMSGLGPSGASFISHDARDLARPLVAEVRASGRPVLCWTIRSARAEAAARVHADNITFEGYAAALPEA